MTEHSQFRFHSSHASVCDDRCPLNPVSRGLPEQSALVGATCLHNAGYSARRATTRAAWLHSQHYAQALCRWDACEYRSV